MLLEGRQLGRGNLAQENIGYRFGVTAAAPVPFDIFLKIVNRNTQQPTETQGVKLGAIFFKLTVGDGEVVERRVDNQQSVFAVKKKATGGVFSDPAHARRFGSLLQGVVKYLQAQ